jgi:membrane protein insertase Oxa1/YidC/SpoIIIJ
MIELLQGLFVEPLMRIYGMIFAALPHGLGTGGRIVAFSVILNLILMPLYQQMEKRSRGTRALRQKVTQDVERMQRHFKGRERYFYIRAVYRQYGYHPLSHALGSADLAVQVVVFFTVFHFLSGLQALSGASFGPLHDLSRPDGLLGGVNLLPFVMTAVNIGATFAYTPERSRRVQALLLAGLFLVLLYNSPSGLVLYWTTNNLFSLVRNAVGHLPAAQRTEELRRQFAELREQR